MADFYQWATVVITVIIGPLVFAVGWLFRSNVKMHDEHQDCLHKQGLLALELARVNALMEALGDFGDAIIVVDAQTGVVTEWNPNSTVLFHWNQKESIGKPFHKLIPDEYLQEHQIKWSQWISQERPPKHGPFDFFAMTKEGTKIPVTVRYAGWMDGGKKMVAANIRKRDENFAHQEQGL